MISAIIQILFALAVIGVMYVGLKQLGGVAVITSQVAHFQVAFNYLILTVKNFATTFPWVIDLVALVTAVIAIEFLVISWKVAHFVLGFVKSFKQS